MKLFLLAAARAAFLFLPAATSAQATILVPGDHSTLAGAFQAAASGDTILVSPGTYAAVAIDYLGRDIALRSVGGSDVTVIDSGSDDYRRAFLFRSGETNAARLEGFTIRSFRLDRDNLQWIPGGGAVAIMNASPVLRDVVFEDCNSYWGASSNSGYGASGLVGGHGGAVFVEGGSPRFERCVFRGNEAGWGGNGGLGAPGATSNGFNWGGNGTRGGNGGGGGDGGALYLDTDSATVVNCLFEDNLAGLGGGAGRGGRGGDGFHFIFGYTTAAGHGGSGGTGGAGGKGGAIFLPNGASASQIINCTLKENTPGRWGASALGGLGGFGAPNGNTGASGSIGPDGTHGGIFGAVTVTNSILVNDGAELAANLSGVTYSLIEGGYSGLGNIDADPAFTSGSARPNINSPCIDAGNGEAQSAGGTDLDGRPRFFDQVFVPDTGVGGAPAIDIGAFEYSRGTFKQAGCNVNGANTLFMAGSPSLGQTITADLSNPYGTQGTGSLPFLMISAFADPNPCGTEIPNAGMQGQGLPGALLLDVVTLSPLVLAGPPWVQGESTQFDVPIPVEATQLAGLTLHMQGIMFDLAAGNFKLTQGWQVLIGY